MYITDYAIPPDEPCFLLRAQDLSACQLVALWLSLNYHISEEKRKDALSTLEAMRQWSKKKKAD